MALRLLAQNLKSALKEIEGIIFPNSKFPTECFSLAVANESQINPNSGIKWSIKDVIGDGILWAVPRFRRSIEKRLTRKFGLLDRFYKCFIPRTDMLVCNHCGHDYQRGHLCKFCYSKVKAETEQMQEAILKELGLNPVEEEVVVLYKGEKESQSSEFWQGKRIVEMKKERPAWFSRNLMQRTTIEPSNSTEVKPENLA